MKMYKQVALVLRPFYVFFAAMAHGNLHPLIFSILLHFLIDTLSFLV
jgi:hypothetical protein